MYTTAASSSRRNARPAGSRETHESARFAARSRPRLPIAAAAGAWLALAAGLAIAGCAAPEDPARVELRARLQQETPLTEEELMRLTNEVSRTIEGKSFQAREGDATRALVGEQRTVVFAVLSNRAGLFDEGLRRDGGSAYRVLNGPARSDNAEIEASQRLWIDVETFLPFRYQFAYAFPGFGDYAYDLIPAP
jgi:hypothetical protein